jgi:hypothetical protein
MNGPARRSIAMVLRRGQTLSPRLTFRMRLIDSGWSLISLSSRKLVGRPSTGGAIGFASSQYGPDDPGVLIGDRHRRTVEAAPQSKLVDPLIARIGFVRGCPHHRSRAVDEQTTKMLAPPL